MATIFRSIFALTLLSSSLVFGMEADFSLENLRSQQPQALTDLIIRTRKKANLETLKQIITRLEAYKLSESKKISNNKMLALTKGIESLQQKLQELDAKPKITDLSQSTFFDLTSAKKELHDIAQEAQELEKLKKQLQEKQDAFAQKQNVALSNIEKLKERYDTKINAIDSRKQLIQENENQIIKLLEEKQAALKRIAQIEEVLIPAIEKNSIERRKSIQGYEKEVVILKKELAQLEKTLALKKTLETGLTKEYFK